MKLALDIACGAMILGAVLTLVDHFFMLGSRLLTNVGMALVSLGAAAMFSVCVVLVIGQSQ